MIKHKNVYDNDDYVLIFDLAKVSSPASTESSGCTILRISSAVMGLATT